MLDFKEAAIGGQPCIVERGEMNGTVWYDTTEYLVCVNKRPHLTKYVREMAGSKGVNLVRTGCRDTNSPDPTKYCCFLWLVRDRGRICAGLGEAFSSFTGVFLGCSLQSRVHQNTLAEEPSCSRGPSIQHISSKAVSDPDIPIADRILGYF